MPKPFTKADADRAEVLEANLAVVSTSLATAAVTPGCQVYWPAPFEVCGRIRDKFNQTGGPNGFLLFPKSNELTNPDRVGKRSEFLGGNIYWTAVTDAHPVAHDFLTKWGQYGYEASFLKYPITDEILLPGGGRRQELQGGSIYWSLTTGAHSIQGLVRDRWYKTGAEQGLLGYPMTDENGTPDGKGRYNQFQNFSAVYWSMASGAWEVSGPLFFLWWRDGWEAGKWGYPVGSPFKNADGEDAQNFQNGVLSALYDVAAVTKGERYYDCFIKQNNPHHSTHDNTTINLTGFVKCDDPKLKITAKLFLAYGDKTGDCDGGVPRFLSCPNSFLAEIFNFSNGSGRPPAVTKNLPLQAAVSCVNGRAYAIIDYDIYNADGGKLPTKRITTFSINNDGGSEINDCPE